MLRLSPFRIHMFQQCKQLYKFFYLDGIKEHYDTAKPPIVMGEHVHRALDEYYAILPDNRSEKKLHHLLRTSWARNRKCFGDKEKMWGERALFMLSQYYQHHHNEPDPLYREQYVDMTIRPDLILLGKIDRVDASANNEMYHVIDYKTGREKEATHHDTFQLLLYSLLIQEKYHKPVERASFWYLATGKEQSIQATEDDLQAVLLEVEEIADTINMEETYEPSPNQFCKNCDFREICPAFSNVQST